MKKQIKITEIDIENITNDYWFVIESMWEKINTYKTYRFYEVTSSKFTLHQQYLHAIDWVNKEVRNGGFTQLFLNSTGLVWENACKGFNDMKFTEIVKILEKVEKLYGTNPSKNLDDREIEIENNGFFLKSSG